MARTIFDMSMSLDGFMTAPVQPSGEPLGRGGMRLPPSRPGCRDLRSPYLGHLAVDSGMKAI